MSMDAGEAGVLPDRMRDPELEPTTDAGLMRRVIEGSEEALAQLYDRHADPVYGAALRVCRDAGAAAEVVQETFLALWNRAELFDPLRGSLRGWLLTIARNRAVDQLRAAGRHDRAASFSSFSRPDADDGSIAEWLTATGDLIAAAGPEVSPEGALSDAETRAMLADALASLPAAERSVIVLAYDGGLSQSEIAIRLGWPLGTVKTRTRRALSHLRDRLAEPAAVGLTVAPAPAATPCH